MATERMKITTKPEMVKNTREKRAFSDMHAFFAHNLKQLRLHKDLTQEQLGRLVNPPIFRETIADAENGRAAPTLDFVQRLADALRVSPLVLLDDTLDEDIAATIERHNSVRKIYPYPHKKLTLIKKNMKSTRRSP